MAKFRLVALSCLVLCGCVTEEAFVCLEVTEGSNHLNERLRSLAREVAHSAGGDVFDSSDKTPKGLRVQVVLEDSDMTLMDFGMDTPLLCYYGDITEEASHTLLQISVDVLKAEAISFRIARSPRIEALPETLRNKIKAASEPAGESR